MFQFRAFPPYGYLIHRTVLRYCLSGFPHSEISGSTLICSSPKLIAACRVLHRLLMPRHSPCALYSLTYLVQLLISCSRIMQDQQKSVQQNCIYPFKKFHNCCLKCDPLSRITPSVALLLSFPLFSFQGAIFQNQSAGFAFETRVLCTLKIEQCKNWKGLT